MSEETKPLPLPLVMRNEQISELDFDKICESAEMPSPVVERLRREPHRGHYYNWEILFEPRDIWIGVRWRRWSQAYEVDICVLPMIPLRIYFQWGM